MHQYQCINTLTPWLHQCTNAHRPRSQRSHGSSTTLQAQLARRQRSWHSARAMLSMLSKILLTKYEGCFSSTPIHAVMLIVVFVRYKTYQCNSMFSYKIKFASLKKWMLKWKHSQMFVHSIFLNHLSALSSHAAHAMLPRFDWRVWVQNRGRIETIRQNTKDG